MKGFLTPLAILAALLGLSLWNASCMASDTARWRDQLAQADVLAQSGDWAGAEDALEASYDDWADRQTRLHIVTKHDAVDDAEAMYRRAAVFICLQEESSLLGELSDLRHQLRLLSEMEQLSIKNVL